jgi:hypothetical protein
MHFVNAHIQRPHVKQPVGVVEEHLARQHADDNVAGKLGGGRQFGGDAEQRRISSESGGAGQGGLEAHDQDLVAKRNGGAVPDLGGRGLPRRRLDLVALGEGRPQGIEGDEGDAGEPPEDDLDEQRAHDVDGVRVVRNHDVSPGVHYSIHCRRGGVGRFSGYGI